MYILYKYIYIISITFLVLFELVSANTARQILWTHTKSYLALQFTENKRNKTIKNTINRT